MRRKPGAILPIEVDILNAGVVLALADAPEFHGYLLAREIQSETHARRLLSHGTLYKALDRMAASGLLESRWEDPSIAATASRPRRRLYRVTSAGAAALAAIESPIAAGLSLQNEVSSG